MSTTRRILSAILSVVLCAAVFAGCGAKNAKTGVEDGVLTIAMECAYAPFRLKTQRITQTATIL